MKGGKFEKGKYEMSILTGCVLLAQKNLSHKGTKYTKMHEGELCY
jgi:hypothetical protein